MDKDTFFDSQLWLLRLSDEEMEGLQKNFKFFTLLADAYCCFQVDERLMFFTMDQHEACDATQLHIQVLLSVEESYDKDVECKRESAPGLYFVIERQTYFVNHTFIIKISVPNNSNGGTEPPSACIDWPGLQMRWWLGISLLSTVATKKISHAVRVMNKILLPALLSHGSISTAKLKRQQKSVTTSALLNMHRPQDVDLISESNKNSSSSKLVLDVSRAEGHSSTKLTTTDERGASTETLTESTSSQLVVLSERFGSWMDFIEMTSRVLTKDVTSEIICDSFLYSEPRSRRQHDASMSAPVDRNSASNVAAPQSPYRAESATKGGLCLSECLSDQSLTDSRPHKRARQQPPYRNQEDAQWTSVQQGKAANSVSHSDAAVASFVRGILSGDEAARIGTELEGQRAEMENAIQDQLRDLYTFYRQPLRDGGGRRRDDGLEDKDAQSRLLALRIETLLGDMQGLVEGLAILRAMPRSADV